MVPRDLFNLFVCNIEKVIVWCISAMENYYNLTKNSCYYFSYVRGYKAALRGGNYNQ